MSKALSLPPPPCGRTCRPSPPTTYAINVFSTLRLEGSQWNNVTNAYDDDEQTENVYLPAADARAFVDTTGTMPALAAGNDLHVFFEPADHLGSTAAIFDKDTSELVERDTFQAYGNAEIDYQPARWSGFHERYRFTGKEDDSEVGLTYFGARGTTRRIWGASSVRTRSRFTLLGADLNPYAYVRGRVSAAVDLFGLDGDDLIVTGHGPSDACDADICLDTLPRGPAAPGGTDPGSPTDRAERNWRGAQAGFRNAAIDRVQAAARTLPIVTLATGNFGGAAVANRLADGAVAALTRLRAPVPSNAEERENYDAAQRLATVVEVTTAVVSGGLGGGAAAGVKAAEGAAAEGALGSGRAYSVAFETTLEEVGAGTRAAHFKAANTALSESLSAETLEELGISVPRSNAGTILGESPSGWTWHHVPDQPGVVQLVPRAMHQGSTWQPLLHPGGVGGFKLWGADY